MLWQAGKEHIYNIPFVICSGGSLVGLLYGREIQFIFISVYHTYYPPFITLFPLVAYYSLLIVIYIHS